MKRYWLQRMGLIRDPGTAADTLAALARANPCHTIRGRKEAADKLGLPRARNVVRFLQGLRFKQLKSQLLSEQHIAEDEMALRLKTQSVDAATLAEDVDVHGARVSDTVMDASITTNHIKVTASRKLLPLYWG